MAAPVRAVREHVGIAVTAAPVQEQVLAARPGVLTARTVAGHGRPGYFGATQVAVREQATEPGVATSPGAAGTAVVAATSGGTARADASFALLVAFAWRAVEHATRAAPAHLIAELVGGHDTVAASRDRAVVVAAVTVDEVRVVACFGLPLGKPSADGAVPARIGARAVDRTVVEGVTVGRRAVHPCGELARTAVRDSVHARGNPGGTLIAATYEIARIRTRLRAIS